MVFKDGVGDLGIVVGLFDFMDGKAGFDLDGEGNEVVVFEKEEGFDYFNVLRFDRGDLNADRFRGGDSDTPREAAVDVVLVIGNEGVLVEDFVGDGSVERGRPGGVDDEVAKGTTETNAKCGGTAGGDKEGDWVWVGVYDVKEAMLLSLEFNFFWGGGFHCVWAG